MRAPFSLHLPLLSSLTSTSPRSTTPSSTTSVSGEKFFDALCTFHGRTIAEARGKSRPVARQVVARGALGWFATRVEEECGCAEALKREKEKEGEVGVKRPREEEEGQGEREAETPADSA